jgi:peroxiredoxin family protein
MSIKNLRSVIFMSVMVFLFAGLSMAQDKKDNQDSQKMNDHMKMDHSQMQQNKDAKEFDLKAIDKNNDGKVYQCPMDFDVLSDKPGKDSGCGMALEEVSVAKAAANLESKGFKVKGENKTASIVREGVIDLKSIDTNKDGKVYQDMMDYNVISDAPGTCPLCGMTLKEVSLEKAKTNLIKNGFKVK